MPARVNRSRRATGPARAEVCGRSAGGTLPPCRSTNSAATGAERCSRSSSGTASSPSAPSAARATSVACSPPSPSIPRQPISAARERPRAAPPVPAPPVPPAADDAALEALRDEVERCSRCVLRSTRTHAVFGEGDPGARLMFVGEAPGYHEDQQGRPFVGPAGRLLEQLLASIGLTREQVYIANVLKDRPPNNRDPRPEEIDACRPYLLRQIEIIKPRVICTLGNFATKLLSGDQTGITRVHGRPRATEIAGCRLYLYPIFHPAAALYTPAMLATLKQDVARLPSCWRGRLRSRTEGRSSPPPRRDRPGARPSICAVQRPPRHRRRTPVVRRRRSTSSPRCARAALRRTTHLPRTRTRLRPRRRTTPGRRRHRARPANRSSSASSE